VRNFLSKNSTLIIILVVAGFFVYAFNFHNPLFWDDDDWIVNNPFVHNFGHIKEIFTQNILSGFGLNSNYYRPLLLISFAVNYTIHGIKPFGYHLLSNGFHIANGVLLFLILLSIFKRRLPAFIAALLFLIHPLQTEAVTYISGRGDPMSVFFILLALWLFAKTVGNQVSRKWIWLALSLVSMILAILSRETAVLLPALLMVFYIAFLSNKKFWRSIGRALFKTLPFWGVTVIYAILRLTVLNFNNTLNFYSQANIYTQHLSYRLFTFSHALVEYFKLIFVPVSLHMERNVPLNTSLFQWPVWLGALAVLGLIFLLVCLYRKEKTLNLKLKAQMSNAKSNPKLKGQNNFKPDLTFGFWNLDLPKIGDFRVWFFGWGWFFAAMLPVSGIVPINAPMYEHWLYLPMVGFFFVVSYYLAKLFNYLKESRRTLFVICVLLFGAYISFYAVQSVKRNILWGQPIKFYGDILKYSPDNVRILNNLGNLYLERGELDKAIDAYKKAVTSPSGNIFAQPDYNLGNIYRDRGETEEAVKEYKKAIEIDPNFPFAYQNLAVIYVNRGDLDNAAKMLEKVKELRPMEPMVYYNLGLVYLAQNKKDLALENLNSALKLSSNDPQTSAEIKKTLEKLGK